MTTKCQCFTKLIDSILLEFRKDKMKKSYTNVNNLKVSNELLKFVNEELLKDTTISPKILVGFDIAVHELAPNKELLKKETYKKK